MDTTHAKQNNKRHIKSKKKKGVRKPFSKHDDSEQARRLRNPKAFAVNSAHKAEVTFRRLADWHAKKHHVPNIDRSPAEGVAPPYVVAIVGPPQVGKSTLIKSLVKNFTRQPVTHLQGPVTLVTGKKRRITLIECANDINSMIDVAKVADLALLLIDAKFGYEMETFEFLNICQVHGFPQVIGCLTHLDQFVDGKQMKKTKKKLKRRFWTDVYQGAKLFYLSGLMHHDEYKKHDVQNLGRFIGVQKYQHQLQWRATHPYVLVDRVEDATDPDAVRRDEKCDRRIFFYGYMRGGMPMRQNSAIHIPGVGDYANITIDDLPDPCPMPDKQKRRALNERERQVYAPFSGIGGVLYDKDAMYIDIGGSHHMRRQQKPKRDGDDDEPRPADVLIDRMLAIDEQDESAGDRPLDVQLQYMQMQLVANGTAATAAEADGVDTAETEEESDDETDLSDEDDDDTSSADDENDTRTEKNYAEERVTDRNGRIRRRVAFNDDDDVDAENGKTSRADDDEESGDENDDFDDNDEEAIDLSSLRQSSDAAMPPPRSSTLPVNSIMPVDDDEFGGAGAIEWKRNLAAKTAEKMLAFGVGGARVDAATLQRIVYGESLMTPSSKPSNSNSMNNKFTKQIVDGDFFGISPEKFKTDDEDADAEDLAGGVLKRVDAAKQNNNNKLWPLDGDDCSKYDVHGSLVGSLRNVTASFTPVVIEQWKRLLGSSFVQFKLSKQQRARAMLDANSASIADGGEDAFLQELAFSDDQMSDDDDDVMDDFHDLETGVVHKAVKEQPKNKKSQKADAENQDAAKSAVDSKNLVDAGNNNLPTEPSAKADGKTEKSKKSPRGASKHLSADLMQAAGEAPFLDELRRATAAQTEINQQAFSTVPTGTRQRIALEGFRAGTYVRICVAAMSCEFIQHFDPSLPVILGGLRANEHTIGYVSARYKCHRWSARPQKSSEPLVMSIGWRRFQTVPTYYQQDHNMRNRFLKYTPKHAHVYASFWAPLTPQGSGVLAVYNQQITPGRSTPFRIAGTGVVLELDKTTNIVKKLKLTGEPYQIYKKTAFVKNMFTSALEVTKFEGAAIRTVSGVRGQIKKALHAPPGAFRAGFEDRILPSDIVFIRAWVPTEAVQYFNPVTNLLLPPGMKHTWQGMRTSYEVRREMGLPTLAQTAQPHSQYLRQPKPKIFVQKPLVVPRALEQQLPYKDKPKNLTKFVGGGGARRAGETRRVAVIKEPQEQRVDTLLAQLRLLQQKRAEVATHRRRAGKAAYRAKLETYEAKQQQTEKRVKKQISAMQQRREKRQARNHPMSKIKK